MHKNPFHSYDKYFIRVKFIQHDRFFRKFNQAKLFTGIFSLLFREIVTTSGSPSFDFFYVRQRILLLNSLKIEVRELPDERFDMVVLATVTISNKRMNFVPDVSEFTTLRGFF